LLVSFESEVRSRECRDTSAARPAAKL
jgi:hypothetical protein